LDKFLFALLTLYRPKAQLVAQIEAGNSIMAQLFWTGAWLQPAAHFADGDQLLLLL
jgi:hypothetical protein